MAENFTVQNGFVVAQGDDIAASDSLVITAAKIPSNGYYEAENIIVENNTDVNTLSDSAGDFTSSPDTNITIDSFTSAGISSGNSVPVVPNRVACEILNTAAVSQDIVVTLREYNDDDD